MPEILLSSKIIGNKENRMDKYYAVLINLQEGLMQKKLEKNQLKNNIEAGKKKKAVLTTETQELEQEIKELEKEHIAYNSKGHNTFKIILLIISGIVMNYLFLPIGWQNIFGAESIKGSLPLAIYFGLVVIANLYLLNKIKALWQEKQEAKRVRKKYSSPKLIQSLIKSKKKRIKYLKNITDTITEKLAKIQTEMELLDNEIDIIHQKIDLTKNSYLSAFNIISKIMTNKRSIETLLNEQFMQNQTQKVLEEIDKRAIRTRKKGESQKHDL